MKALLVVYHNLEVIVTLIICICYVYCSFCNILDDVIKSAIETAEAFRQFEGDSEEDIFAPIAESKFVTSSSSQGITPTLCTYQ